MVFSDNPLKEEILIILPLKGKMRGKHNYHAFLEYASDINLPLQKLISITSDGTPAVAGSSNGSLSLCRRDRQIPVSIEYCCVIHQEALFTIMINFKHVTNVVTVIMNFIHSISLKHRSFKAPLDGIESEYSDLVINTEEHWLSRGKLYSRFLEVIPQI
jgi:hypothetical protein